MSESTPDESGSADLVDEAPPPPESSADAAEGNQRPARWRGWVAWALVVVGAVFLLVASFNVWIKEQALDTDAWVAASGELLEDDEIRSALSSYLVDELFDNVDVAGRISAAVDGPVSEALPFDLSPVASLAAGALREPAVRVTDRLLASSEVQTVWEDANRAAHVALLALLDGDSSDALSTNADGTVVLNLQPVLQEVGDQVGISVSGDNLPAGAAQIELFQSDELAELKEAVKVVRVMSFALVFAVVGLFGLAIWIGRGRRRALLGGCAAGLILVGVVLLVIQVVAGHALVDALVDNASTQPAGLAAWGIATELLASLATVLLAWGAVILIGVWLAGPRGWAVALRRWLAPLFRDRPALVWGIVALGMLLVLLWGPSSSSREIYGTLLTILIFIVAFESFRRLTVREFTGASANTAALQPAPEPAGESVESDKTHRD